MTCKQKDTRGGHATPDQDPPATRPSMRVVLYCLMVAVGLGLLLLPLVKQWWGAWEAGRGINVAVDTYDYMNDEERVAVRKEAARYNQALAGSGSLADCLPYENQLSFGGSEMIAYLSVPKCSIRLPVYHGTEDNALAAGVGHLMGTSLPVGGESTHCVLTAHTGMPNRRMFDDIHLLQEGDTFVLWVLGMPLTYRVVSSEVVLPEQTESLAIVPHMDLVTLVTCTPPNVNSHRLLVHAERCPYEPDADVMPDAAVYVNGRTAPLLVALFALLLLAIVMRRHRHQTYPNEKHKIAR